MIKSREHMQNFCLLSLRHLTTSALSDKKSDSADARCTTLFSFAIIPPSTPTASNERAL